MKNYFLIVDTETTMTDKVADFGAVIVDSKGQIIAQCAAMVRGIYDDPNTHPLFFSTDSNCSLWNRGTLDARYSRYDAMLASGARIMATPAAINRWLDKAKATYNPILTAYNLPFDLNKCANTGIDLTSFGDRKFCLWSAAYTVYAHTKAYRAAVLAIHAFNAPTALGNMTYKTNAETMARFLTGNLALEDEPHTALEDAIYYELPILRAVLKKLSARKLLGELKAYNWRECQVRDFFKAA